MEDFDLEIGSPIDEITENPVIEDIPSSITPSSGKKDQAGEIPGEPRLIGTIKSASYGGLTKILSLLTDNMGKTDIISIEKGKLSTISGGGYLYCDLSVLFGENNFDIIDPKYSIKLMKLISGGDEVTFIDDESNSKYYISNMVDNKAQITITLVKPDPSMSPKITEPNLGALQEVVQNIDPDLVNTITSAEKGLDSQFFILEVIEDPDTKKQTVISISTDYETFKFNFKDSWDTNEGQETVKYKLFNPFPIPKPDEIEFQLHKNEAGDLWVKTTSEVGMANIDYMERLTPMGIFDSFQL